MREEELWLAIIGIILFVGTLIFGFVRRNARRKKAVRAGNTPSSSLCARTSTARNVRS